MVKIFTSDYSGPDRRKPRKDGKEGRRPADLHCSEHNILWEHHEEDKKQHRGLVCGKITKVELNLSHEVDRLEKVDAALDTKIDKLSDSIVGKYWFRVVMGLFGVGIVFLYTQNKEILANQHDFTMAINAIEKTQVKTVQTLEVFKNEIENLNNRQDVLRDAHMKILNEHKEIFGKPK